jgi:type I restriction enzyme S subunit
LKTSAGSLSPRTNWDALAEFEFLLPPKDAQGVLTDALLAASVMGQELAEAELRVRDLLLALAEEFCRSFPRTTCLKSIVTRLEAGVSPPSSGEPATDGPGVLKVSAVGDWDFAPSESKAVESHIFDQSLSVRAGDVLFTRANADPSGVGRSCIVHEAHDNLMLSDKTWRAQFVESMRSNGAAVVAVSKSRIFRNHVHRSHGGTEAKNISQALLLDAPVPAASPEAWADLNRQVHTLLESRDALRLRRTLAVTPEQIIRAASEDKNS